MVGRFGGFETGHVAIDERDRLKREEAWLSGPGLSGTGSPLSPLRERGAHEVGRVRGAPYPERPPPLPPAPQAPSPA